WFAANDAAAKSKTPWTAEQFDDSAWPVMRLPQKWNEGDLPNFHGVVWFRKEITLPAAWDKAPATLFMTKIDDRDTTYVNGVEVGDIDNYTLRRRYAVPANVLHAGRNIIAVRVYDGGGSAGIYGSAQDFRLEGNGHAVPLAGPWRYEIGLDL